MSDSVRPHRRQPTRLPHPWDPPGKSTGVGCHFLLQCMKVKSESEVTQSCLTLSDPMDCSPLGSSVHGIFQARVLEWGAITFSGRECSALIIWPCWQPRLPASRTVRKFLLFKPLSLWCFVMETKLTKILCVKLIKCMNVWKGVIMKVRKKWSSSKPKKLKLWEFTIVL